MGNLCLQAMEDCVLDISPIPLVLGYSLTLIMHLHPNRTATPKAGFSRVPNVGKFVLRPATFTSRVTRRRLRGHPEVQLNVQLLLRSQPLNA